MATRLTYKQLHQVLEHFGFQKREQERFVVYENTVMDAMIALPGGIDSSLVRPAHLLATKMTLIGKGIASATVFEASVNTVSRPTMRKPEANKIATTHRQKQLASNVRKPSASRTSPKPSSIVPLTASSGTGSGTV